MEEEDLNDGGYVARDFLNDPLDQALGLPPMEAPKADVIVPEPISEDDDYEFARASLYRLVAKGELMLDELGDIARISQHPRGFEVYSNLLKAIVDTNKDLMGLKKTAKEVSGVQTTPPSQGPQTVNNTLIATSEEILRMIKDKTRE